MMTLYDVAYSHLAPAPLQDVLDAQSTRRSGEELVVQAEDTLRALAAREVRLM
jgi:hypothetical protein